MATRRGRARTILTRLVVMLLGVLAAGTSVEVGLRLFWRGARYGFFPAHPYRFDPTVGYLHKPSIQCRYRTSEFDVVFRTNPDGFRGNEPFFDSDGGQAVAVLGDSFVQALGVDEPETFVGRLGKRLLVEPLAGRLVLQIQNYGLAGTGAVHHLQIYRHHVRRHRPGIVIVCFYRNDILDSSPALAPRLNPEYLVPSYDEQPDGTIIDVRPFRPAANEGLKARLRPLATYRFLQKLKGARRWQAVQEAGFPFEWMVYEDPWRDEFQDAWRYEEWCLKTLFQEIRADGAQPLLVSIASREVVSDAEWAAAERLHAGASGAGLNRDRLPEVLARLAAAEGVPFLDLAAALGSAMEAGAECYYPMDLHLAPAGHGVVAEAIGSKLRELE